MSLVLDASVTLAWLNEEETTPTISAVFDRLAVESAWVPGLWWLEVANALQMGLRRKRYTTEQRDRYLEAIELLTVSTDKTDVDRSWRAANDLADRHSLTVYDAAYLELALRHELPLATLDRELRVAALNEHVLVVGG